MNRLYLESLSFIDLPSASLACMDIFCIFMHYAASLCHILIRRFGRVQKGTCPTPGKIWSKDGQVEGDWRGWNMLKHWTIRRGSQDTTHFKTVLCHCYTHFLSFFGIGQILFKHWIHDAITPNCFKWFHRRLSYIMFIIYHIYHISIEHRKMLRAVCVCVKVSFGQFHWILNGSSRFAAWHSSTERVWIQFRKIPSIDSHGPCTDFAGLNHVPPLVLHNQQGSTFWWKCRWLKYVKVIEWRKHTKSLTVRDATMGYNGVRKGPPCPVPWAIQEILTDSQLICNYPSWRICPRHHHRAEKLIEPGTKKPLVAYGQLETF